MNSIPILLNTSCFHSVAKSSRNWKSEVINHQCLLLSFQSLTILASIPAAILILSLFLLLLYLMTRCCDRKSKKQRTFGCQKCTLIFITILCCGAIGGGMWTRIEWTRRTIVLAGSQRFKFLISNFLLSLSLPRLPFLLIGLYGNDDLHNGLVQVFNAGKQLNRLFINVRNQVS